MLGSTKADASTSDTAKYGDSIAKCEAKFSAAWLKAIDDAAQDQATCPDAALAAADFKAVIDAHSAEIATALAGDGFPAPDTCGNATVDAGEDCDLSTPPSTCSAVSGGLLPLGNLTCAPGCVWYISGCQSCADVGGYPLFGTCWFRSDVGGSCSSACSARGLAYDPATSEGASYSGCLSLLMTFYPFPTSTPIQALANAGTACNFTSPGDAFYTTTSTNADASTLGLSRACACRQP